MDFVLEFVCCTPSSPVYKPHPKADWKPQILAAIAARARTIKPRPPALSCYLEEDHRSPPLLPEQSLELELH
jgi:hypothetical protein